MKIEMKTKVALSAFLLSGQVSTAKSWASYKPMDVTRTTNKSLKRPNKNPFATPITTQNTNSWTTSKINRDILTLRAGGIGSLASLNLNSMNAFFKQYPYVAAFLICKYNSG